MVWAALAGHGLVLRLHRKKPRGRPMAARTRRAIARESVARIAGEHVLAYQNGPMGLVVRPIGLARAHVKIRLAPRVQIWRFVCLHNDRRSRRP